jgi:hypothetical protein
MRTRRQDLLQKLIATACRSVSWSRSSLPPDERLGAALMSHDLRIRLRGLRLEAWVTADLRLAFRLHELDTWGPEVEQTLHGALERSPSLVAGLLLEDWSAVRAACAARASGHHTEDHSGTATSELYPS